MTEQMEKAIDKLDKESEKNGGDYMKLIAQYLIGRITDDVAAAKVLDTKKSVSGCMSSVTAKARKLATNSCAAVEDRTVYRWAAEYFGLNADADAASALHLITPKKPKSAGLDIDLTDLF